MRWWDDLRSWSYWLQSLAITLTVLALGQALHLTLGAMFVLLFVAGIVWGICRAPSQR